MAITYFVQSSGSYVAYGLSSDTKPSSPPANCLFIEIDTAKRYRVVANAWVEALNGAYMLVGGGGSGDMLKSDNLSGLTNYTTARSNLGLGTLATQSGTFSGTSSGTNTGDQDLSSLAPKASPTFTGTVSGITSAMVGLGNVNNTSDAGKPVSTAQQTALDLKANITSPTLVTPNIGAATGTSLTVSGALVSTGGGNGYATGAGGTVTQATSRATGVTLNKLCGNITMFSAAVAANAVSTFTLTNSFIAATDFVLLTHISTTNGGAWVFSVVPAAGSVAITVRNQTTASITEATPLRFSIIKGVTA